jgi:protein SCO1/2
MLAGAVALAHGGNFQGVVLGIQAGSSQIIVRQEAGAGRSGDVFPVRVNPAKDLGTLRLGDHISGMLVRGNRPVISEVEVLPMAPSSLLQTVRNAHLLREGDALPQTHFVDQNGKSFTFADFAGQNVVLSFIYTRCRDAKMCPLISSKFAQLQDAFKNSDSHLVEITLDPQYDTPLVLKTYADTFKANPQRWTFGTGELNAVLNFDAQFGLLPFADPRFGLIHTEQTVIIDKRGIVRYLIDDPSWSIGEIQAQLDNVNGRGGNLFARIDLALSRAAVAVCGDRVAGFSGLTDLLVVIVIFAALAWSVYRIGRAFSSARS